MNYASMKKKIDLLKKYEQTRQNLFEHSAHFYDAIGFDIEGYWEEIENLDDTDIKELEKKIKNTTINRKEIN